MVELPICKLLYLCINSIYAVISIFGHVLELTWRWYFSLMHMFRCSRKMRKSPEFQNSPSSQISEIPKVFSEFQKWSRAKKQAGSSRIMGSPFWKVFGLSHFSKCHRPRLSECPLSPKGAERNLQTYQSMKLGD